MWHRAVLSYIDQVERHFKSAFLNQVPELFRYSGFLQSAPLLRLKLDVLV